ncbi:extracellular solute-binding protein [Roseomonas gilardii]|uniref:extracellular solute-binding protein n=1 Tax=Roseomonas gilardii TaxID=257708 RepID=UPI001643B8B5|nr:extracellular solute-binding protein [Roseomonas gilardii]
MTQASHGPSRRQILALAALGAPALIGLRGTPARAAGGEVVMMMSGGSFMQNWQTKIIDGFTPQTGIRVRMAPGNNKVHSMALRSSPSNPPFDVYLGNGDDFLRLVDAGLMLKLPQDKVPSLAEVHPRFLEQWAGHGATFDYSSVGIAYRTDRIKQPPKSWKEFVERTAAGDFGNSVFMNHMAAGVRGPEVLIALSRALTGDPTKIDAGFDALKRMKPNVFKFFSSFNDPVVLLTNDEGAIGPGWDGRTFVAHDETGGKIQWIKPTDGAASSGPVIAAVKGGNEEGAMALVNHALSAGAQKAFCEAMFYGAVNSKVQYSETLAKRLPTPDEILVPDERFLSANVGGWIERWNREIAV